MRYIGLDIHTDSIKVAVAESGRDRAQFLTSLSNDTPSLVRRLQRLGPLESLRCCYEAGPGGYSIQRALSAAGIDCRVIAPSLIPKQSGRRVKTDRLDAENLAHYLRSGDLVEVWIPDSKTESLRNLVRLREDAMQTRQKARQQLHHFLLRGGRSYPYRTTHWKHGHLNWIRRQRFDEEADNITIADYLRAVEMTDSRMAGIEEDLRQQSQDWQLHSLVLNLQALKGISFLSAMTIAAETGDMRRFATAEKLMSYYGLVPSERSSGKQEQRGRITRCGNSLVRRLLVESAWHYRHRPFMSQAISQRCEGLTQKVVDIAWRAQKRLHQKYMRLQMNGKPMQKVCVAVARELAGFIWAIGREV